MLQKFLGPNLGLLLRSDDDHLFKLAAVDTGDGLHAGGHSEGCATNAGHGERSGIQKNLF